MSYELIEVSSGAGRPVFLYEFSIGLKRWCYTSHDQTLAVKSPITLKTETYHAIYIDDSGVKQTGEAQTDSMKISMPFSEPVPQLFQVTPPANPIVVRRLSKHIDDPMAIVNYVGFVTQVNATEPGKAEVECLTLSPTMQRNGLRLGWQRSCPYALYDQGTCKVNKDQFRAPATIKTASNGIITALAFANYPNGWFRGGYIEWVDKYTGATETRGIDDHDKDSIRLLGKSDGLSEGIDVVAYPGCPRNVDACRNKFRNYDNYGGFPFMPGKSPFNGDPLY